jgi:TolA-binding protein
VARKDATDTSAQGGGVGDNDDAMPEGEEAEKAATALQAQMRGKNARKQMEEKYKSQESTEASFADLKEGDAHNLAPRKDLSALHDENSKGLLPNSEPSITEGGDGEEEAAEKEQKADEVATDMAKVEALMDFEEPSSPEEKAEMDNAATKLQAGFRGAVARKDTADANLKVRITVQCCRAPPP